MKVIEDDHEQFSSLSLTKPTSTLTTGESSKNSHSNEKMKKLL